MPKRCPPGFICIENMTVIFLIMFLFFACFIFYKLSPQNRKDVVFLNGEKNTWVPKTNSIFSTIPSNILMNPHTPPLKNNGYFPRDNSDARGVPINIRTRGSPTEYQQMGILTNTSNPDDVRPLYGRQTYRGSNQWNYYSSLDSNLSTKIPIFKATNKCTDERGCQEINEGDNVTIGNISATQYTFTKYSNDDYRYIPDLF